MSNNTGQISPSQFDAQFVLIIITVILQVFQAVVTGIKMRVRCKDCFCSLRGKNSSPGGSSTDGSPKRHALADVADAPAAAAAAAAAPSTHPATSLADGRLEVSLTPRTAAAVMAAVVAATTPRSSISETVAAAAAAADPEVDEPKIGTIVSFSKARSGTTHSEGSRTLSSADQSLSAAYAAAPERRAKTPSGASTPPQPKPRQRSSVPPIHLESVVIED
jgi:hypothetical protein